VFPLLLVPVDKRLALQKPGHAIAYKRKLEEIKRIA